MVVVCMPSPMAIAMVPVWPGIGAMTLDIRDCAVPMATVDKFVFGGMIGTVSISHPRSCQATYITWYEWFMLPVTLCLHIQPEILAVMGTRFAVLGMGAQAIPVLCITA